MKNKNVGFLIVGISFVIVAIVLLFNSGLKDIVDASCDHGSTCTMYDMIAMQTGLSLVIAALILIIGIFLIWSPESERVVIKKVREKVKKKIDLSGLDGEERRVVEILRREKGAFFQKSVMEELGCGKVKMTRIVDKLEAKGLLERKRRGMNNILVLVG
ncbi:MAG TPA: MarR family transcriptional regulator [Candidatus Pacearchaeota archaeon]|nr:MarR family transcriptional regulator [Candidatus Pacearchaeota archaeon]